MELLLLGGNLSAEAVALVFEGGKLGAKGFVDFLERLELA